MSPLDKIRQNSELLDSIDWDMTPEEAVRLYLEWGQQLGAGQLCDSFKERRDPIFRGQHMEGTSTDLFDSPVIPRKPRSWLKSRCPMV